MKREKNSGTGRGGVDQSTSRSAATRSSAVTALQSIAGDPIRPEASASGRTETWRASERAGGRVRRAAALGGDGGCSVVRERVSSASIWGFWEGSLPCPRRGGGEERSEDSRDAFALLRFWVRASLGPAWESR